MVTNKQLGSYSTVDEVCKDETYYSIPLWIELYPSCCGTKVIDNLPLTQNVQDNE